jgi:predicted Zn finger-like uncharacterized protein
MTVRCPYCMSAASINQAELGPAGRMMSCRRCGTRWLARVHAADPYRRPEGAEVMLYRRSDEDAVVVEDAMPAGAASAAARNQRARARWRSPEPDRRGLKVGGAILFAVAALLLLRAPVVSALPLLGGDQLHRSVEALTFNRVRSEVIRIHGVSTLVVDGEVVNSSTAPVDVPAIRVTLKSGTGDEIQSWLVELAQLELAPGKSIGFRSALAAPPAEASEVSLALARREGHTVGLN